MPFCCTETEFGLIAGIIGFVIIAGLVILYVYKYSEETFGPDDHEISEDKLSSTPMTKRKHIKKRRVSTDEQDRPPVIKTIKIMGVSTDEQDGPPVIKKKKNGADEGKKNLIQHDAQEDDLETPYDMMPAVE